MVKRELNQKSNSVRLVVRIAHILKCLCDGEARLKEIADQVGLSKATSHRLLKALETTGIVVHDPITQQYSYGYLITSLLSSLLIIHDTLIISAQQEMKYLRDLCGETVILQILDGTEALPLKILEGTEQISYRASLGTSVPLYIGAAGRVILAQLPSRKLEMLLKSFSFNAETPNTITERRGLVKEINKVREQGYAVSFGERIVGSAGISVPLANYVCPAALSIIGPDNRVTKKMIDLPNQMKQTTERISEKLSALSC